jgi:lipid II:glycine glycyltransferase (peptidoglycan interpeptide bridge formation enzyme)
MNWGRADLRQRVLGDLQELARREHAVFLKIDPGIEIGRGVPGHMGASEVADAQAIRAELKHRHWRFSSDQIQFRNTVLVDLTISEEAMLARMKQKGRYNVRLAERKGVQVRSGTPQDLAGLYAMYAETAARDGFVIRNEGYYRAVWQAFLRPAAGADQPSAELLIAQVEGETVAAIIVLFFAQRAYYMYGMSREFHREKMPNHALQWEAMKRARMRGCTTYDLWGAPDLLDE